MVMTADDLLTSIKRGITVPSYQGRFSDDDILALADEEIQTVFIPMITALRQEYFVKAKTTALVASQSGYAIPERAIGRTLRDIRYVDSGGRKSFIRLLSPEFEHEYSNVDSVGEPIGFYPQEDKIILVPTPGSSPSGSIEMKYEIRPGKLVKLVEVATITAINTGTGVLTTSTDVPATITTATPVDLIQARAGNVTRIMDETPTAVGSTSVTITAANLPSDLVVGDYIALAGETPVVQLPEEAHPVLANAVHCRLLRALGDFEALNFELQILEQKKAFLREALTPRIESKQPVIKQRYGLWNSTWGKRRIAE